MYIKTKARMIDTNGNLLAEFSQSFNDEEVVARAIGTGKVDHIEWLVDGTGQCKYVQVELKDKVGIVCGELITLKPSEGIFLRFNNG